MNALAIASISLLCLFAVFAVAQLAAYIWFFVHSVQKKKLVSHDTNSRVVKKVPLSTRFIAKFSILCSCILIVNCVTLLCQGLLAVPIAESRVVLAVLQTMASVGELMSTLLLIMLSLFICAKIVKNNVKLGRKSLGDLASIRLGLAIIAGVSIITAAVPCILLVVLLFKYDSGVLQALTNLSIRFFNSIYLSSIIVVLAISLFSGASFGLAINKKPSSTTVAVSATAPPVQQQQSSAESPSVDTLTEQIRAADIPAAEQAPAPLAPLKLQKLNKSNLLLLLQLSCLVTLAILHICLFSVDWRFLDLDYQKSFFVFIFSLDKISLLGLLFTFLVILNPRFNLITFKKYTVDEKGDRIEFRTVPASASQADEKSLSEEPQYPSRDMQLSLG